VDTRSGEAACNFRAGEEATEEEGAGAAEEALAEEALVEGAAAAEAVEDTTAMIVEVEVEVEVATGEAGGAGALAGAPGQGQPVGEVDAVGRVREAGHAVVVVEGAPPTGVGAAGRDPTTDVESRILCSATRVYSQWQPVGPEWLLLFRNVSQ
jgi:hypothetical protein